MQTKDYPEVPDDFGHWLAGWIDGEGSFIITRKNEHHGTGYVSYAPYFDLKVRDDDEGLIREIIAVTGIGYTYRRPSRGASHPMFGWRVQGRDQTARLVEILDHFPLRSRKAADFAIWRQAVITLNGMLGKGSLVGRKPGGEPIRRAAQDWAPMAALKQALQEGRVYMPRMEG